MMITRTILCALLASTTMLAGAQRNNQEILIDSQSLASADIRWVEAETEGGNIAVEGVAGSAARLEVYAWSKGEESTIRQRFSEIYDLKINTRDGKLSISALRRNNRHRDPHVSVSFRLYVPVAASTQLKTSGGNIHCESLSGGRQQVMTSGGNIAFESVKGNVSGKTSGGNIAIDNCSDTLELSTSGGNIHARQSKALLSLFTSGGNIALDDLSGKIKAETSGGNVSADRITGVLRTSSSGGNLSLKDLSCAVEASTDGGNMAVTIRKADQYVKLRSGGSGTIHVELPEDIGADIQATGRSVKIDHLNGFKGNMNEREIRGSIKGGGIPVTIDGGDARVVLTIR